MKKYRYSEIFRSIQGEGHYSGCPTVWYRAWGCNFTCSGFGSSNPLSVDHELLPVNSIDLSKINKMEDLPVFNFGCDSGYSWSKRFAHLAHKDDVKTICEKIKNLLPNKSFATKDINHDYHMAFTGGEPMMSQTAIVDIMENFWFEGNLPLHVTIETNGTQKLRSKFKDFFGNNGKFPYELFWSCSPKLSASGEKWEDAIKPEIVNEYNLISKKGQLKFVVDGSEKVWKEVERAIKLYRKTNVNWPVWIMPVGATLEEQEEIQKEICEQTLEKGYNFSARIHNWIWGNAIGK